MGFNIGTVFFSFYGLIIGLAILVAVLLISWLYKKEGYEENVSFHLMFLVIPLSIFAARVFYVIFADGNVPLFAFRDGGMAIYGAVLMGVVTVFAYARYRKVGFFTLADAIVVGLILAQAIGRFGNMTNNLGGHHEVYGIEVGTHIPPFTVMVRGTPHIAAYFIETLFNLIGFVLLWRIYQRQEKWGTTTAAYFMFYGTIRAAIEPLRLDSLTLFGTSDFVLNRISFLISIALVIAGMVILYLNKRTTFINQQNAPIKETKPAKGGKS